MYEAVAAGQAHGRGIRACCRRWEGAAVGLLGTALLGASLVGAALPGSALALPGAECERARCGSWARAARLL